MKTRSAVLGRKSALFPCAMLFLASACATVTPPELTSARVAYARASAGPAAQLMPADLHKAKLVLDTAEANFSDEKNTQKTVDLSYIAERTIQVVEAKARTAVVEQSVAKSKQAYADKQVQVAKKTQAALVDTRKQLTEARQGQAAEAQQAGVERVAREDADTKAAASEQKAAVAEQKAAASEQKTTEANDALAKLAAKDEERGLVITLSGSVLFRSNDAMLLPAAESRLDDVGAALIAKNRPVVVEGYTDSRGSQSKNMDLSQRRAESVRGYLVTRGVPADKIVARGMGPDKPIAENTSAEGRAQNRRVEIVVSK